MDVRGPQFEGLHNDLVHEPDQGRVRLHFRPRVIRDDLHIAVGQLGDEDVYKRQPSTSTVRRDGP